MKFSPFNVFLLPLFATLLSSCGEQEPKANPNNNVPVSENFQPLNFMPTRILNGQLVYIPIYSSIYSQYEKNLIHMTSILSMRNISPTHKIIISKVDYYDTNGKLIRHYIDQPFTLDKMSSKDFIVPESDLVGGTGANFLVQWDSEEAVSIPLFESVMIGFVGTKGFSFSSRGKEIESH